MSLKEKAKEVAAQGYISQFEKEYEKEREKRQIGYVQFISLAFNKNGKLEGAQMIITDEYNQQNVEVIKPRELKVISSQINKSFDELQRFIKAVDANSNFTEQEERESKRNSDYTFVESIRDAYNSANTAVQKALKAEKQAGKPKDFFGLIKASFTKLYR